MSEWNGNNLPSNINAAEFPFEWLRLRIQMQIIPVFDVLSNLLKWFLATLCHTLSIRILIGNGINYGFSVTLLFSNIICFCFLFVLSHSRVTSHTYPSYIIVGLENHIFVCYCCWNSGWIIAILMLGARRSHIICICACQFGRTITIDLRRYALPSTKSIGASGRSRHHITRSTNLHYYIYYLFWVWISWRAENVANIVYRQNQWAYERGKNKSKRLADESDSTFCLCGHCHWNKFIDNWTTEFHVIVPALGYGHIYCTFINDVHRCQCIRTTCVCVCLWRYLCLLYVRSFWMRCEETAISTIWLCV